MNSPNNFMNQEFLVHKKIFNMTNKEDYMMLSSGTNEFPMSKSWKRLMKEEGDNDFAYRLYVSPYGFETVNRSLSLYEHFVSTKGRFMRADVIDNKVCMTMGGSQGAFLAFDYLESRKDKSRVILVGTTYGLYEMLATRHHFEVVQILQKGEFIPDVEELIQYIEQCSSKDIFVFTHPNNPSGEQYSQEEFDEIIMVLKKKHCFAVFDEVCNMVISDREVAFIESSVTDAGYWDECIFINSFSKTDSVPGFRLGFIYGRKDIVDYIFEQQCFKLMSVQSIMVLPIFFTSLFRCIFLNEKFDWNKCKKKDIVRTFRLMFYVTSSIPSYAIKNIVEEHIKNIDFYYDEYVNELLEHENIIVKNYQYVVEKLEPYLLGKSAYKNGFNFMVKLKYTEQFNEIDFVSNLLEKTGIAILSESAFSLEAVKEGGFSFRISLAYPSDRFQYTIDKLYDYLSSFEKEEREKK